VKLDEISLVEAAYDFETPERRWMASLVERAIPLMPGARRGVAYTLDVSNIAAPTIGMPSSVGFTLAFEHELRRLQMAALPLGMRVLSNRIGTLTETLGPEIGGTPLGDFILGWGAKDTFGCVALDATRRGVVVSTDLVRVSELSRRMRSRWELIGAHIAAAYRLRIDRNVAPKDDVILTPGGGVVNADGHAKDTGVRERLRKAVLARDRARTRAVRADPEGALGLWTALVSGRWSLVDRFEGDGRRYIVARRNEPRPAGPLALSLRERQVLGHIVQADSVKLTAYALGLAPSTVSEVASAVRLKLGVRTVAELVARATQEATLARAGDCLTNRHHGAA
jgi:DNA-binding CsgD family transcriptional regulator